jgi:hypothetical protein
MRTFRIIVCCAMAAACLVPSVGCEGQPETGTQANTSAEASQRQKLGIMEAMKKGAYGKGAIGGAPTPKATPGKK